MVSYQLSQPVVKYGLSCLNPYCSGQWSRTAFTYFFVVFVCVLILIVVDNGLVLLIKISFIKAVLRSLNPYCSGQWSRTRPYKTLLIINKLKNFTKQIFTFLNRKLTIS